MGAREVLFLIFTPFGWYAISKIESNYMILTSLSNILLWKIVGKPILSYMIGPFAAVIIIPVLIIKRIIRNRQEKQDD